MHTVIFWCFKDKPENWAIPAFYPIPSLHQDRTMKQHSNNHGETLPLLSVKEGPSTTPTDETPTILEETWDILLLSVPIFISRLSFVGMKTTDSALLGHVSRKALSASALSDLWTMCSQVLLNGGILGVLVGGAVGAGNPKLAGIYLQVSYVVLSSIAVFVIIAWNFTEQVWLAFGSDREISEMAGYYASVLSVAIPGIVVFGQLSQFFSAQRIMSPEVTSASMGLIMNLVLGLIFVLGWPIPGFAGYKFEACPIVTTCVTYVSLATMLVVYVHFKKLHAPAWGGWDFKEITWERIKTYCELYFPAALSSASDFWRMAVVGAFAARMGEEEVAVFNTSYRYDMVRWTFRPLLHLRS
jgi:multidrug resistance protein, MATE family